MRAAALAMMAVGALAFAATPCQAQSTVQPRVTVPNDSAYRARMNAGYALARAGNQLEAARAFDDAANAVPGVAEPLNAAGYAYISAKRNDLAIARFNASLAIEGDRDGIRRQVGYLYAAAHQNLNAIAAFDVLTASQRATPQDFVALGNLHSMNGDRSAALASFRNALETARQVGDSATVHVATVSLRALAGTGVESGPALFAEYFLAPFYQQRFGNVLTLGFARAGVSAGGWWRPAVYASVRATRDSKSVGGSQPILYADNSVLPALGVRVQPGGRWLTLYAEAGAAYPLVAAPVRDWHRDLRAGAIAAMSMQHTLTEHANGPALITDAYADASWYDRFDRDVIAYAQLRESLRVVHGRAGAVDLYGRAWGAFDSRNSYANRVVEGGGGIALHAGANHRVSLYVDVLRGHYLTHGTALQAARNYNDFRVTLVTGWYHAVPLRRP
jgi:tetratricopeptide (TPR) repeat protein